LDGKVPIFQKRVVESEGDFFVIVRVPRSGEALATTLLHIFGMGLTRQSWRKTKQATTTLYSKSRDLATPSLLHKMALIG
jgi:hypothetical protein